MILVNHCCMKTKLLFAIVSLLLTMGVCSCSDKKYDPEDYITSILSGEYEKEGMWELTVSINGTALDNYGYVRMDSKYLEDADFKFVDIIPGESIKEYKNIPLVSTEDGLSFTIKDIQNDKTIIITGIVTFGKMSVDIKL